LSKWGKPKIQSGSFLFVVLPKEGRRNPKKTRQIKVISDNLQEKSGPFLFSLPKTATKKLVKSKWFQIS